MGDMHQFGFKKSHATGLSTYVLIEYGWLLLILKTDHQFNTTAQWSSPPSYVYTYIHATDKISTACLYISCFDAPAMCIRIMVRLTGFLLCHSPHTNNTKRKLQLEKMEKSTKRRADDNVVHTECWYCRCSVHARAHTSHVSRWGPTAADAI